MALPEPNDKQGKPKICIACSGTDKGKPILGLVILRYFSSTGDRYKGTIIDPNDGKLYTVQIWVEDGKLMLRGYVGFFYQTRTWLKGHLKTGAQVGLPVGIRFKRTCRSNDDLRKRENCAKS